MPCATIHKTMNKEQRKRIQGAIDQLCDALDDLHDSMLCVNYIFDELESNINDLENLEM